MVPSTQKTEVWLHLRSASRGGVIYAHIIDKEAEAQNDCYLLKITQPINCRAIFEPRSLSASKPVISMTPPPLIFNFQD